MKKYIYPLAITAAMLATTACSDDEVNAVDQPVPDSQKEMISFSLGDNAGTRAGFTVADTKIVMRIQSEATGQTAKYTRTVATGQRQAAGTDYSEVVFVSTSEANNVRYWDDAHGRNSLLSVFAVAIPDNPSDLNTSILSAGDASKEWGTTASHELASDWTISTTQNSTKQAKEDLVYSNNIKAGGKNGVYSYDFTNDKYTPTKGAIGHADGQMKFQLKDSQDPTSPGKFNRGHLVFKHALSRLTIELVKSTGFAATDPFKFKESTQITLLGMPTKGKLNVATGEWTVAAGTESHETITSLYTTSTGSTAAGTYMAQVLPGYSFMENSDENVLSFTIDGNTYYVTQKDIYTALNTTENTSGTDPKIQVEHTTDATPVNYIQMKEGKNYSLKINVEKAKIQSITATLADWVTVTAEDKTPSNSRITLSLATPNGSVCNNFDLYRLPQTRGASDPETTFAGTAWSGNYTDYVTTNSTETDATKKMTQSNSKWATPWYYEDNLTYYHFRTVNEGTTINENTTATDDYFVMSSGTTDYHWGAPMKHTSGDNFKYVITSGPTEGYTNALYPAIGSTTSDIKIQEIHMMSSIEVILKTVSGDEGVKLLDGTKGSTVELTYFSETGDVKMGNGFITPSSTIKNKQAITSPATTSNDTYYTVVSTETRPFTYYVVPQPLVRTDGENKKVGITITTPDNNTYYVVEDLASIKPSSVGSQAGQQHSTSSAINRWYPGHKYTYTFTLKKKKIESITCSVADWVTVTAGNTDLNLEGVIPPATTGGSSD